MLQQACKHLPIFKFKWISAATWMFPCKNRWRYARQLANVGQHLGKNWQCCQILWVMQKLPGRTAQLDAVVRGFADPFISPRSLTMTPALSSKYTNVPSFRRHALRWRTTTPSITFFRSSGLPFFTVARKQSPRDADLSCGSASGKCISQWKNALKQSP